MEKDRIWGGGGKFLSHPFQGRVPWAIMGCLPRPGDAGFKVEALCPPSLWGNLCPRFGFESLETICFFLPKAPRGSEFQTDSTSLSRLLWVL